LKGYYESAAPRVDDSTHITREYPQRLSSQLTGLKMTLLYTEAATRGSTETLFFMVSSQLFFLVGPINRSSSRYITAITGESPSSSKRDARSSKVI
jgi:hypothetical protein